MAIPAYVEHGWKDTPVLIIVEAQSVPLIQDKNKITPCINSKHFTNAESMLHPSPATNPKSDQSTLAGTPGGTLTSDHSVSRPSLCSPTCLRRRLEGERQARRCRWSRQQAHPPRYA